VLYGIPLLQDVWQQFQVCGMGISLSMCIFKIQYCFVMGFAYSKFYVTCLNMKNSRLTETFQIYFLSLPSKVFFFQIPQVGALAMILNIN